MFVQKRRKAMVNLEFKMGKVINFDNYTGEIIADDNKYIFFDKDIQNKNSIKNGDVVCFRAHKIQDIYRAMLVTSFEEVFGSVGAKSIES